MTRLRDRHGLGPPEVATFRARGVMAPFTGPMLASARVRAADRDGVELVLPNPSGGPSVFITDWSGASTLRSATLHDTVLFRRIVRLGPPNPRLVREAALSVAEEGYAGPVAADSARRCRESDRSEHLRIEGLLSSRFTPSHVSPTEALEPAERRIARTLGIAESKVTAALRICYETAGPFGIGGDGQARLPRIVARLDETVRDIDDWIAKDSAHDGDGIGMLIVDVLRNASTMVRGFIDGVRRWFGDPLALLRRALTDPASLREQTDRALWLLDGWEKPALIWQTAGSTAMRRLALLEIAHGLPSLPAEVAHWTDPPVVQPAAGLACQVSYGGNARLSAGAAISLVRRNEALRALSL